MFAPNRRHTWQPEASCARDYQDLACSGGGSSDSLLEGTGFEPSVPPKKRRSSREAPRPTIVVSRDDLCLMTPSSLSVRHLSSATAERPFTRAGPMVRIRFPPAGSLQTFGLSLKARGSEPQHADPSQAIGARKSGDNQLHRFRVLEVRIQSPPADSPSLAGFLLTVSKSRQLPRRAQARPGGTAGRDAPGSSTSRQLPVMSLSDPIPVPQCRLGGSRPWLHCCAKRGRVSDVTGSGFGPAQAKPSTARCSCQVNGRCECASSLS